MNTRETLKPNSDGVLFVGGVSTLDLVEKYGTPLYVLDRAYVEEVCRVFTQSLDDYYGLGYISYASKAFCCKEIYRIVNDFDMHADVVSYGEMFTAISAGFSPKKLTFHGNNKSLFELEYAIDNGIKTIVIDSLSEIDEIDSICSQKGVIQEVLIRVNPGVEAHTHHYIQTAKTDSKFGFSISNGDALNAIKHAIEKSNIKLTGLHCHIGSQIFEKKSFILAVEKMTDFYLEIKNTLGYEFTTLNLGGGFGIYYSNDDIKLKSTDYALYVKEICDKLNECILSKGLIKPELVLEPGRSIVGEAGITLYTAGNVKQISGIKNYVSVDGGMFDNPRFALYQARYSVEVANKMLQPKTFKYSIAGKCCESGDLIAEDVMLPKVNKGDIIAVLSTGAYNYSMASNYNRNFVPPVVCVNNGQSKIIVKKQTAEDLIRNDV